MKLQAKYVEKPWGRIGLPAMFDGAPNRQIGEVWFVGDGALPLLAKYLFTGDRLSIQVHPDDEHAKARGFVRGKSECWYIVDAEPDARIGLGLSAEISREELRSAAVDGSIVELIDWRPGEAGDCFYVPAGTIHAIDGRLSLVEFQQNADVTFRLYDYGRQRPLQLDDASAVARLSPYPDRLSGHVASGEDAVLVDGPQFTLVHTHSDTFQDRRRWILPLEGSVHLGNDVAHAGDCLVAEPGEQARTENARMLIGAES
jgi:mannose-6-phosphate isomerase